MPVKKPSRPRGKSSDPSYVQRSVLIRRDLFEQVQAGLTLFGGQKFEFSLIVGHLLEQWVKAGAPIPRKQPVDTP
jgi:hypothetical protein